MKRRLLFLGILGLSCVVPIATSAQTQTAPTEQVSPELQARIRKLVATLGPDPSRGSDVITNIPIPTKEAKEDLIAIGKPATLPLCEVLKEKDVWRRMMAVEALVEIRDRRARDPLLKALQSDPSFVVRGEAAEALGEMGDRGAVPALIETLKVRDTDPSDSYPAYAAGRAAVALGKIGDRRAIPALLPLLGSREYATGAVPGFRFPLGPDVATVLGKLGSEAAGPLMQLLQHPNREVRSDAVKALGVMKERRAVPLLLALLSPVIYGLEETVSYEDWKVGIEAVKALGEIGDKRATVSLMKLVNRKRLLDGANGEADVVVVEALGKMRDTLAVETLLPLLASTDSYVRLKTLEALWRVGTPKVVEPLLYALQHDDDFLVRSNAAEWLGQRHARRALPALQEALRDERESVRFEAAIAIGRIDSKILLSLLKSEDKQIRRWAITGLVAVGCKQIVPDLLTMLDDEEIGSSALDALGSLGTPGLLPRLETLLNDENLGHRWAARRAVIAIKRRYKL